jgi:hypothetical protein
VCTCLFSHFHLQRKKPRSTITHLPPDNFSSKTERERELYFVEKDGRFHLLQWKEGERIKQDETRDRERLLCVRYGNVYYGNRRNRGNDRGKKSLGRFTVKSPD